MTFVATVAVLLAGCADTVPGRAVRDPSPAVPCLAEVDDGAFARCVQRELDAVWSREFRAVGRDYTPPRLTVPDTERRRDGVEDRAYFSPRSGVHVPTRYLDDLRAAHGSQAHIVLTFTLGHETGHHVQNLLHPRSEASSIDAERQADCYAGVWARQEAKARALDVDAFRAGAEAELRRLSADPDEIRTHGTVRERIASLQGGIRTGDPATCDTADLTWP